GAILLPQCNRPHACAAANCPEGWTEQPMGSVTMFSVFRNATVGAAALALATTVLPAPAGAVPQTGDVLDITATSPGGAGTFSSIFASPLTVGPGVSDTAIFQDSFGEVWNLTIGFTANGFTVDDVSSTLDAHVANGAGVVEIFLDDLTQPIGPIVRTDYSCVAGFFAAAAFAAHQMQ